MEWTSPAPGAAATAEQGAPPADAPISVSATGLRNAYDLVMTADGRLYTVDNGRINLAATRRSSMARRSTRSSTAASASAEPLSLIEQGENYGHPNPTRSNQNESWTAYNDAGNPDTSLAAPTVSYISTRVPAAVNIADGLLIDPSKFTSNQARLTEEGIRVRHPSAGSEALVTIGSSSNGLVEYKDEQFGGALKGDLLVAQFNGNVARLNLNATGTTATYETTPDVGAGDPARCDGWTRRNPLGRRDRRRQDQRLRADDVVVPVDPHNDDYGIPNKVDPFLRDASNGGQAMILPNKTIVWDFDANLDGNRPGPGGYGGGLSGGDDQRHDRLRRLLQSSRPSSRCRTSSSTMSSLPPPPAAAPL